jgi:hypothetical protein
LLETGGQGARPDQASVMSRRDSLGWRGSLVRAGVRDRLNPTELQGSGVGVRGTGGPRCDHVGLLGSRAMMRASIRVSGVDLRPGVPGSLGYGVAARQGALTPFPCLELVVGDVAFGPVRGSRDRLSGRLCWGPGGSRAIPALGGPGGSRAPPVSRRASESACSAENRWRALRGGARIRGWNAGGAPTGRVPSRPTAHVVPAASSKATGPCEDAPAAKRSSNACSTCNVP